METVDSLKRLAIARLCEGCTKFGTLSTEPCERTEEEKFYAINFSADRPCIHRRAIAKRRKDV